MSQKKQMFVPIAAVAVAFLIILVIVIHHYEKRIEELSGPEAENTEEAASGNLSEEAADAAIPAPHDEETAGEVTVEETPAPVKDPNRQYTPYELIAFGEVTGVELDGITYVYYPDYFEGPRGNGKEDRRQDIVRLPDSNPTNQHLILRSVFLGQHFSDPAGIVTGDPGDYDVYWAKITLDDSGQIIFVERVPMDGGRFGEIMDANRTHSLYVIGGAKEEEQGYYALVAEKMNDPGGARYAYVSEIIELYIKD